MIGTPARRAHLESTTIGARAEFPLPRLPGERAMVRGGQRKDFSRSKRTSKPPLTPALSPSDGERESSAQLGGTLKMRPGTTQFARPSRCSSTTKEHRLAAAKGFGGAGKLEPAHPGTR